MSNIPVTDEVLVLRTDFSDDIAWEDICGSIRDPGGEFKAYVDFLSDRQYEGITSARVLHIIPENYEHSFIFIVDQAAILNPECPILVIDLYENPGQTFRVIPSEVWAIENNLSLANMDFSDFANAVDQDGVFRGFPEI